MENIFRKIEEIKTDVFSQYTQVLNKLLDIRKKEIETAHDDYLKESLKTIDILIGILVERLQIEHKKGNKTN